MTSPRRRSNVNVGRAALFSVVVVGLTIGMLTVAGTRPLGIGRLVENPSRVQLNQRTFSCGGGIAGAEVRSGNLSTGLAPTQVVPTAPPKPVTVVANRPIAPGAFAGQQAITKRSLAWLPCPEPAARWWFVAAGGASITHDTVLTISNPRAGVATFDVDVYGPGGLVDSPNLRNLQLPAGGSTELTLSRYAPSIGDLAVSITATRGLVAASAADRFSPGIVSKAALEWLPPQLLPARVINLTGMAAQRGSSTLLVVNPTAVTTIVKVAVIGSSGTFTPAALSEFIVGPQSVKSISLASVIDGTALALRITSQHPITATVRSIKGGDSSFATGVEVLRGSTSFGVPDGAAQLTFSSVRSGTTLHVVAFDAHGTRLIESAVKVAAQTTTSLVLPAGTKYVSLVADRPEVIVGFSVVGTHGTATAGVSSSIRSVQLPTIRPGW